MEPSFSQNLWDTSLFLANHSPVITLLSFVVCSFFSFLMLTSYPRAKSEKWMQYFGLALLIFAIEFLMILAVQGINHYLGTDNQSSPGDNSLPPSTLNIVVLTIRRLFSIVNNILFIATARKIENKSAYPSWCRWLTVIALTNVVVGRLIQPQDHIAEFILRSGDDIFSIVTLFLLGRAVYVSNFRIHRRYAFFAMFTALFFELIYFVDWMNPLIIYHVTALHDRGIKSIYGWWLGVASLIAETILFYLVYSLFQRFIEILSDLTEMQKHSMDEQKDYLSSEGVVQLIGKKLAGEVNLVIFLPGEKERRVALITWPDDDAKHKTKVLMWENIKADTQESLLESKEIQSPSNDGAPFVVIEPIKAHGAAIGCLKISRSDYQFSQMAVRQIRAIANLIAPAVQSYRELAALDLLSIRFAERQGDEKSTPPSDAAQSIAEIIHEVFSPVATSLTFNFGFQTIKPTYLGDDAAVKFINNYTHRAIEDSIPLNSGDRKYKLFKKKLTVKSEDIARDDERPRVGNLLFAVFKAEDSTGRPALGAKYLHRKAAATLASDAYFDFARDYFGDLVKRFGTNLSRRTMSVEEWFKPVQETANAAGMSWIVAAKNGEETLGQTDSLTLASILEELNNDHDLHLIHEDQEKGVSIRSHALAGSLADARHIIEIRLPGSETVIWLGVERDGFKDEMAFTSPWRNFLVDFARIADTALTRITFAIQLERKQIEAANYQGLAAAAAVYGVIVHQLSKLTYSLSASISTLSDTLDMRKLPADEEIRDNIHLLKRDDKKIKTFLSEFTSVTKADDHCPSKLNEAVNQANNLFEASLLRKKITLHNDVNEDLMIEVPFLIAMLAIANLIGNAKDATHKGGEIRVSAESNGTMILCRVVDQGYRIPEAIREKIFNIGFSTKNGEGSGWGLYLTKQSLQQNRSRVELTQTSDGGSTFTVYFPKSNNGSNK